MEIASEIKWVAEQNAARLERSNKRFYILNVILILILLATNMGWLYYESQYKVLETTVSIEADQQADGDGTNYIVGGDYGNETKSQDDDNH